MSPEAALLEQAPTLTALEESLMRSSRLPLQADNADTPNETRQAMSTLRSQALARLQYLGAPTKKLEAWKYIPVHQLLKASLVLPEKPGPLDAAILKEAGHLEPLGRTRLAFIDGFYSPRNSALPEDLDVTVSDVRSAYPNHKAELLPLWQTQVANTPDMLEALNMAGHSNGAWVHVTKDTDASSDAIHIACFSGYQAQSTASFQQHHVTVGAGAKATVVLQCLGLPVQESLSRLMHQVLHIDVANGGTLDMIVVHDDALANGWQMMSIHGHIAEEATLNLTTVSFGLGIARDAIDLHLDAEGALVRHHGLTIHQQQGQSYLHSTIYHHQPNGESHQLVKSILDDGSKNDFDATIVVDAHAQKTDATQLNKNLLLSDDARAWTRPQLKIVADDVKCAHGATVGQLNPEEMFYLASRGMPAEMARCLLTYGFAADALSSVTHSRIFKYLTAQIVAALGQTDAPLVCGMECGTCKSSV